MSEFDTSHLRSVLERSVLVRTGRRVRNLAVELLGPKHVVLRGQTTSYYVKQLAQHGIRDVLPQVDLENTIDVNYEMLTGSGAA